MSVLAKVNLTSFSDKNKNGKLIEELSKIIKQCQKRYYGIRHMVPETDELIGDLCKILETILIDGLHSTRSTLQLIKRDESNKHQLWTFLVNAKHLDRDETERFVSLKQIWTDWGRARAWLRSTLNERSLDKYLRRIINDKQNLTNHYNENALLRDVENSEILIGLTVSLQSILFAINIDNPLLNSALSEKNNRIINEPIIENVKIDGKIKKKKRVNEITFDE